MRLSANSRHGASALPSRRRCSTLLLFLLISLLTGATCTACTRTDDRAQELQQASSNYKMQRDYNSLEIISGHLHKGMSRSKVEELLGKADYSPIEGQEYYSSDRREAAGGGKERRYITVGLVVEYCDEQGKLTGQLQRLRLGAIGE